MAFDQPTIENYQPKLIYLLQWEESS